MRSFLTKGETLVTEKCALQEQDGFLMLGHSNPKFNIKGLSLPVAPLSDNEAIISRPKPRMMAYFGYILQKK